MNVLFVNATRKWGGEKTWALDTALELERQGHHCTMVGRRGNRWTGACSQEGLAAHGLWFGFDFNPVPVWNLVRIIKKHSIECVVVNISKDLRAGCIAGAIAGVPVVRHIGSSLDMDDRRIERLLYRHFIAGMVVVGHRMKEELLERVPWVSPDMVKVVHLGKDHRRFTTKRTGRLKRELGLGDDTVLIGVTSQLVGGKGHGVLLEAFHSVAATRENSALVLVGEGFLREELESTVARLGLAGRVFFAGFQRDIPEVLSNLDLYVLPSFAEGFPNTLVEAMACGLPCVSTDVSCVPEILADGENGYLVSPGDAEGLARALGSLSDDGELRRRFGNEARRQVERAFTLRDKAAEFVEYLEAVVNANADAD